MCPLGAQGNLSTYVLICKMGTVLGDTVMLAWEDEIHIDSILFHSQEIHTRRAQHLTAGSGIRTPAA